MVSAAQRASFISKMAPIAQAQARKHGNKIFPSICIAQACHESGFGTSQKMVRANAVFGIKVGYSKWHFGTAWKDKAYSTVTKECYDGKTYVEINDMFRAYDSIEDSVEDYFDLLCTAKRYQYALNQPTPRKCIEGIQKAPYATGPDYIERIMALVKQYNLTQYDPGSAPATPQPSGNPYPQPKKLLRMGSKGNDVKWVQWELGRHGYKLTVDGIWGKKTEAAVRDFQSVKKLVCDGIVGPATIAALKS